MGCRAKRIKAADAASVLKHGVYRDNHHNICVFFYAMYIRFAIFRLFLYNQVRILLIRRLRHAKRCRAQRALP